MDVRPKRKELDAMGPVVMLMMLTIVVLALAWSGSHRLYREVIRRRQVTAVRAVLEGAPAQASADLRNAVHLRGHGRHRTHPEPKARNEET